jgi:hypothetical protein
VTQVFDAVTLVRPAVMFGPDDAFLTRLVKLVRTLPVYPMFGRGQTRLQPVYSMWTMSPKRSRACWIARMGRIAPATSWVVRASTPIGSFSNPLPGRWVFASGRFQCRLPHGRPWQALAGIAEFLLGTPLTRNQIALMEHDNIASDDLPGLPELSVTPTALEAIVHQITGRRPR